MNELNKIHEGMYFSSKINYKNMIQNLADMYPYNTDEIVLVECIANSLDAKSSKIFINYNPAKKILSIQDNGNGMSSSQFRQYHDFAMALKSRGGGIGFAGLGAKISFNIANRVVTETRSKSFSGGSDWGFNRGGDLVWKPIKRKTLKRNGTKVEIHFNNATKIQYKTTDDILKLLLRHYAPLFDTKFLEFYKLIKCYEKPPIFIINNKPTKTFRFINNYQMSNYVESIIKTPRKGNKPVGFAFFGLLPEHIEVDVPGILLCTWGKVIKTDFLNQFPGELMNRIFGIAEIPNFVKFITTSKCDLNYRRNPSEFNSYYKPLKDSFIVWLKKQGIDKKEEIKEEETRELERELSIIITSFPEIPELMYRKASKKIQALSPEGENLIEETSGSQTYPNGEGKKGNLKGITGPDEKGDESSYKLDEEGTKRGKSISRKAKSGPKIAFQNIPEKEEMGWVDGDIVYINSGHPGYKKTSTNKRSRLIFNLVSVASALQRYLKPSEDQADNINYYFIDKFLYAWGK